MNLCFSIFFPFVVLFMSCYAPIKTKNTDLAKEQQSNVTNIDGYYSNKATNGGFSLWWAINYTKWHKKISDSGIVQFKTLDDRKIKAYLLKNNGIVDSCIIKKRIKEGYVITKTKQRYIGVPVLFFSASGSRLQFSIDSCNNLVTDHKSWDFGWILMFDGGEGKQHNQYKRVK